MPLKSTKTGELRSVEIIAKLMDSQFQIPGTKFRFGLDPVIGLIPGVGDFTGFLVSGYMILICARNGASGFLLARMTLNIIIDALIGSIPLIGDMFDFAYKANNRNLKLMRQHYVEGRHNGNAWKVIIPILLVLFVLIAALAWISYKAFVWLANLL
ncbi:MAG: DUF4112 domain-containing protein [Parafilimonas sp.]